MTANPTEALARALDKQDDRTYCHHNASSIADALAALGYEVRPIERIAGKNVDGIWLDEPGHTEYLGSPSGFRNAKSIEQAAEEPIGEAARQEMNPGSIPGSAAADLDVEALARRFGWIGEPGKRRAPSATEIIKRLATLGYEVQAIEMDRVFGAAKEQAAEAADREAAAGTTPSEGWSQVLSQPSAAADPAARTEDGVYIGPIQHDPTLCSGTDDVVCGCWCFDCDVRGIHQAAEAADREAAGVMEPNPEQGQPSVTPSAAADHPHQHTTHTLIDVIEALPRYESSPEGMIMDDEGQWIKFLDAQVVVRKAATLGAPVAALAAEEK